MKNSEMTVALELIKSGDAKALRELVCEGKDTDEFVFGGSQIRAIVTAIALAVRPGHALMDFAIDLAAPWVDVLSLCEMTDMMIPRAGITEVSPSVDEDISVKSLMESGEFASAIDEMDDDQLFVVMRVLYAHPVWMEELLREDCEALARRVYSLSRQSDLNYFFGTGKQALLAYATLIPDSIPAEDSPDDNPGDGADD